MRSEAKSRVAAGLQVMELLFVLSNCPSVYVCRIDKQTGSSLLGLMPLSHHNDCSSCF